MTSAETTVAAVGFLAKVGPYFHLVRNFLHVAFMMLLMAAMCLPVVDKLQVLRFQQGPPLPSTPWTVVELAHEYLMFGYRYYKTGTIRPAPLRKARSSLGLVAIGSAFLGMGPMFLMAGFNRTLIVMYLITFIIFLYTVINMRVGTHFFNQAEGANRVGHLNWGPSQTFHVLTIIFTFIPLMMLCIERCVTIPARVTPYIRRVIILGPMILALIFAVTGDGTAQAVNREHDDYTVAWHYNIMSYDYSMAYMKKLTCSEFYKKLSGTAAATIIGCFFAFVAWLLSLFASKRPMIAVPFVILAFILTIPAVAVSSTLRKPITCDQLPALTGKTTRNQGDLALQDGFTCLLTALFVGFIDVVFSVLTRNFGEVEADASAAPTETATPTSDNAPDGDMKIPAECEGEEMKKAEPVVVDA